MSTRAADDPATRLRRLTAQLEITASSVSAAYDALANVTATSPEDCPVALASEISEAAAKVDATIDSCPSTAGMEGCRFEPGADPACLGDAATTIGTDLVEAVFATAP